MSVSFSGYHVATISLAIRLVDRLAHDAAPAHLVSLRRAATLVVSCLQTFEEVNAAFPGDGFAPLRSVRNQLIEACVGLQCEMAAAREMGFLL